MEELAHQLRSRRDPGARRNGSEARPSYYSRRQRRLPLPRPRVRVLVRARPAVRRGVAAHRGGGAVFAHGAGRSLGSGPRRPPRCVVGSARARGDRSIASTSPSTGCRSGTVRAIEFLPLIGSRPSGSARTATSPHSRARSAASSCSRVRRGREPRPGLPRSSPLPTPASSPATSCSRIASPRRGRAGADRRPCALRCSSRRSRSPRSPARSAAPALLDPVALARRRRRSCRPRPSSRTECLDQLADGTPQPCDVLADGGAAPRDRDRDRDRRPRPGP